MVVGGWWSVVGWLALISSAFPRLSSTFLDFLGLYQWAADMKRTTEKHWPTTASARRTDDNLCKRLAEDYPEQFARWLFDVRGPVRVEKTKLSRDPIRADSVIFSSAENETLPTEFQATRKSEVALPLRFL